MLHREFVTLAVLAALMSTFAVIRHTRQNEELGRAEMLGSDRGRTVCRPGCRRPGRRRRRRRPGRGARRSRSLVAGQPVGVSLLAGASVAAVGLVWVGVAAVTCQLSSTTRGATGIAAAVSASRSRSAASATCSAPSTATGMRVTSAWLAWLSPIGWGQQTRPFGGARWWPLLLAVAALVVLLASRSSSPPAGTSGAACGPSDAVTARRARPLLSPVGLVWRLQRGAFLGWAVGLTVFGLIFGNLTEQIQGLEGTRQDWWTEVGGTGRIVDAYQVSIIQMAGMFVAIYVVQVLLRMRVDESGGTLEPVLASGVTRTRWLWGHVANAVAGAVALMVLFAVSMGLAAGQVLGGTGRPGPRAGLGGARAAARRPVVGAAVVAVICLLPRWSVPVSWALLLFMLVAGPMFGPGLDLPASAQDLLPVHPQPQGARAGRDRRAAARPHRRRRRPRRWPGWPRCDAATSCFPRRRRALQVATAPRERASSALGDGAPPCRRSP